MEILYGLILAYLCLAYGLFFSVMIVAAIEIKKHSKSHIVFGSIFDYIFGPITILFLCVIWPFMFIPCYGAVEKLLFIKKS